MEARCKPGGQWNRGNETDTSDECADDLDGDHVAVRDRPE
jgi:hypothetical protein